jgi:hypothetical protein
MISAHKTSDDAKPKIAETGVPEFNRTLVLFWIVSAVCCKTASLGGFLGCLAECSDRRRV